MPTDWNAGVPACNVAFFSGVKSLNSQIARAFSCFALMQAGTPAFQSHPPPVQSKIQNLKSKMPLIPRLLSTSRSPKDLQASSRLRRQFHSSLIRGADVA